MKKAATRGPSPRSRIERERKTVYLMIRLFCRRHHRAAGAERGGAHDLCSECAHLYEYTRKRLATCRFGEEKPVCSKCSVHCYAPGPREQIRRVMRFSGPRMLLRHPYAALIHLTDSVRSGVKQ